jgi:hypothetical protein
MSRFDDRYDVALSYSRDDGEIAQAIAGACHEQGLRVFFDQWAVPKVWGQELLAHLHDLYLSSARYCLPLISGNYVDGMWTKPGSGGAQERSFAGEAEYLLPVRLDDSYVPALRLAGPYLDLRKTGPAEIARLLRKKLDLAPAGRPETAEGDPISKASANQPGEESASEPMPGFERVPVENGPAFAAPEILEMLDRIDPTAPPRQRLRFGNVLRRLVSWEYIVRSGPVYTAWRVGNRVFLSMLPDFGAGPSERPRQRTFEFEVNGTPAEGLTLVAEWAATNPVWNMIDYGEVRDALGEFVADRSGCNMFREVAVDVLSLGRAKFAFPVAPDAGPPERFCRWIPRERRPPLAASDWDRDPRLVESRYVIPHLVEPWISINGLALLLRASGVGVMNTILQGGWPVTAVYALQDALHLLLPTRHVLRPLDAGAMRLCVFLSRTSLHTAPGVSDSEAYDRSHPLHAIRLAHAAIARAVAAQREIPIAPPSGASALPRLHPKVGKAFRVAEEALGAREHPDVAGYPATKGDDAWELLADSSDGRRINICEECVPFDFSRVVTRSDLAAFIEGCENQTLAL